MYPCFTMAWAKKFTPNKLQVWHWPLRLCQCPGFADTDPTSCTIEVVTEELIYRQLQQLMSTYLHKITIDSLITLTSTCSPHLQSNNPQLRKGRFAAICAKFIHLTECVQILWFEGQDLYRILAPCHVKVSFCNNVALNVIILKMTLLINQCADWPPNYHKTVRLFTKYSAPPHSDVKCCICCALL